MEKLQNTLNKNEINENDFRKILIYSRKKLNNLIASIPEYPTKSIRSNQNLFFFQLSYKKNAERLSNLFRDQLETPLERAVFWTEFVLRHNGTNHMTLGSRDLLPLQRKLVDVYLILFVAACLPLFFLYFCLKKVYSFFISNQVSKQKQN